LSENWTYTGPIVIVESAVVEKTRAFLDCGLKLANSGHLTNNLTYA
jgi:hypothetical protein